MEHILLPVLIVSIVFGSVVLMLRTIARASLREREMLHTERMAAIEKGILAPDVLVEPPAAGTGQPSRGPRSDSDALHTGLVFLAIGVGMTVALRLLAPDHAWWAWGLIPLATSAGHLVSWAVRRGDSHRA